MHWKLFLNYQNWTKWILRVVRNIVSKKYGKFHTFFLFYFWNLPLVWKSGHGSFSTQTYDSGLSTMDFELSEIIVLVSSSSFHQQYRESLFEMSLSNNTFVCGHPFLSFNDPFTRWGLGKVRVKLFLSKIFLSRCSVQCQMFVVTLHVWVYSAGCPCMADKVAWRERERSSALTLITINTQTDGRTNNTQ